jgi:hypothetical protein
VRRSETTPSSLTLSRLGNDLGKVYESLLGRAAADRIERLLEFSEVRRKVSFGDSAGVGIVENVAIGRRRENRGRVAVGPTPGVGSQMVCTAHDLPPLVLV